jgi:hypothetical protein
MGPGHAVAGYWDGDLRELQSSSSNIGWGELFVPLAAVRRMGPALKNSHIVFAIDNAGDVEVINRRRTSSPRMRTLLRELCGLSLQYNFAFTAIHRPGARNILPDILSRTELHCHDFRLSSISNKVLKKIAEDESSKRTSPEPKSFAFGSFFLLDPVSKSVASSPVLFPLGISVLSSSSASLQKRTAGG